MQCLRLSIGTLALLGVLTSYMGTQAQAVVQARIWRNPGPRGPPRPPVPGWTIQWFIAPSGGVTSARAVRLQPLEWFMVLFAGPRQPDRRPAAGKIWRGFL